MVSRMRGHGQRVLLYTIESRETNEVCAAPAAFFSRWINLKRSISEPTSDHPCNIFSSSWSTDVQCSAPSLTCIMMPPMWSIERVGHDQIGCDHTNSTHSLGQPLPHKRMFQTDALSGCCLRC
uniref:Uncharacterized protein n=1 Tax=Craspedostauros australis TaxID=1486917 RepID=A0A7R9WU76_9STRA|mmetsp:Transcript_21176/g.58914  ORF Transcript_21176/g.58914 Transcript_21176/m.58914 type:complete len:123 (+) Transcript_21176:674-1042(+)